MKKIVLLTILVTLLCSYTFAQGTKKGGWQVYFTNGWYSFGWCQNKDKPSGVRTWSGSNNSFTGQGGSFSASWTAADFNWIPDISRGGDGFGPIKSMVKNWNVQWNGTANIQGNGTTYTFGLKFNTANFNGYKEYNITESYECYIITSTNKTASQLDGIWFADVYPEGDPVGYQLRKAKVNWGFGDFIQLWAYRKQNTYSGPVNVQAILQAWSDKSGTAFKTDTWYLPGGVSIMNECFGSSGRFDLTNIQIPNFNICLPLPHTEVVTSRGETLPDHGRAKANDGISTTTWIDSSQTTWLQYAYITAPKVNMYSIISGSDATKDPKSWTLQASDNDTNWVTLDSQINQTFASRSTEYKYLFSNETAYKYYKIDITTNNGSDSTEIADLTYSYIDSIKPGTPENLTFSNSTYILSWSASTDNVGVVNYEVFNNGASLGKTIFTSLTLTSVKPETEYNFTVKAIDNAGNWSAESPVLKTKTGIFSIYEAENATTSGGGFNTNHPGFSGTGFWDNVGTVENYIEFTVYSAEGGGTDVACRYSSGGAIKTMSLYVNGIKIKNVSFSKTANWDTWGTCSENVALNAGNNTVMFKYDKGNTGFINVDYIQTKPNVSGIAIKEQVNKPTVYPNPVNDFLLIKNYETKSIIQISDMSGNIVLEQPLTENKLNISKLTGGIYIVRFENRAHQMQTIKIVKQ